MKIGKIYSETSFYTVQEVNSSYLVVKDELGNNIKLSKEYVNKVLNSAEDYFKEEKLSKTALAELFINSPRLAMTVAFYKSDKEKSKTQFNKEKAEIIKRVSEAKVSEVEKLLNDLIENPILKIIPGELRVMKGRHNGNVDDLGRVHFIDMEVEKGDSIHDSRIRQVDPRTIQYLILNDTKYTLK
jgi:hypothetical protein